MSGDEAKEKQKSEEQAEKERQQAEALRLAKMKEEAEKASQNPDKDLAAIYRIDAKKTLESQKNEVGTMQAHLIMIIVELKKAGADVTVLKENPTSLEKLIETYKPLNQMPKAEQKEAAKEKVMALLKDEGPTANYIKSSQFWVETVGGSNSIFKNATNKYNELFKKYPVPTLGMSLAIAMGIGVYLGSKLFSKKSDAPNANPASPSPTSEKKLSTGSKIAIVGALGALGLYFGKDKIMGLFGSLMKSEAMETLKGLGLDTSMLEEIHNATEKGIALTEQTRQFLLHSGEEGKQALAKVEADIQKKQEENGQNPEQKEAEKQQAEVIDEKNVLEAQRHMATIQALVGLYFIESSEDKELKSKMTVSFEHLSSSPVSRVLEVYQKATAAGSKEIAFESLGLEENTDMSPEALFHSAVILHKAYEYHKKHAPEGLDESMTVKNFLLKLSNDPALAISNKVQASMEEKFKDLKIGSFSHLKNSAEEIFETNAIDEVMEENKGIFIEHLATQYGIDMNSFTALEKAEFIARIGEFYTLGNRKLNQNRQSIENAVKERAMSPKVAEACIVFWGELKDRTKPLLEQCKKHYDIKRPDNEKYDQILQKNLEFDSLYFSDGIELALLSDGINFEEGAEEEGVGQMKEISMVYLMARILKKRNEQAYSYYVSNLIDLSTEGKFDLKFNPRFKAIMPYFNRLFDVLMKKTKEWAGGLDNMMMGLRNLNDDPDKIAKIAEMDQVEFASKFIKSGIQESYQIPRDLFLTLYENYSDLLQVPVPGENIMEMILALGGTLIVTPREDGNHVGLVYLGGKYYFFKPAKTLLDSTKALATEGLGVSMKTYLLGTTPFIVWGALGGFKRGITSGPIAAGISMLRGVARGATAPVSMPIAGYRAIRGTVRYTNRWFLDRIKYGAGNTVTLERSLRLFLEYSDKAPSLGGTIQDRLEFAWDQFRGTKSVGEAGFQIKRTLYADLYEEARIRWGKNFARDYNNFFGLNPEGKRVPFSQWSMENAKRGILLKPLNPRSIANIEEIVEKAERMEIVTAKLRQLKDLGKLSESDFMTKLEDIFEADELAALKERSKKIGFKKFQKAVVAITGEKPRGFIGTEKPILEKPSEKLTKPTKLSDGRYSYMGEKISLSDDELRSLDGLDDAAKEAKLKELCHQEWTKPKFLDEGPAGKRYRYRGGTFVISDAELSSHPNLTEAIESKYASSIKISEARKVKAEVMEGGKKVIKELQEFKINGQWIRPAETDDALKAAQKSFVEAAKEAGMNFDHVDFSNSKVLKYFPILKELLGPGIAAITIYHLETTPDKRKAVAEAATGFAGFMGGMKLGGRATQNWTPKSMLGVIGKGGVVLFSGMLGAYGLTESLEGVLESYMPNQQISGELASLMEKAAVSATTVRALTLLESKKAVEFLGRRGLGPLANILSKQVDNRVFKKVHQYATSGLLKKIGTRLGFRGAILAGTLADDATVIGVLDDFIAAGMAAWMAKDIADIMSLASKSWKINAAMERFNRMPIKTIEPADMIAEKSIEAALANSTKSLEEMNDEEKMELIRSMGDVRIKMTREGSSGYEEYRFMQGEVFSTKIKTDSGEVLELTDEELNQEIALPAPQEFQPFEIDYTLPSEQLQANYRLAILYTKSECGWTKLDHEIVNDNEILIRRLDGGQSTRITRAGDQWNVEGYSQGNTLYQAFVLANLKNKVQNIIEKEGHVGGSVRPFSIDGESIDFDKSWNPNDLRVLSGDTGWLSFYDKIGLSRRAIVDMLNNWYQTEQMSLSRAA